jgi:uncharacterized protein YggU (UPF0235/DUF167 family)
MGHPFPTGQIPMRSSDAERGASSEPYASIPVWVKPGSVRDALHWDPWRRAWNVSCTSSATRGEANRAVATLLAVWLRLPPGSIRWIRSGTSRSKLIRADGIPNAEAARRLGVVARLLGARAAPSDRGSSGQPVDPARQGSAR